MAAEPMISLQALTICYGEFRAVDDLDLESPAAAVRPARPQRRRQEQHPARADRPAPARAAAASASPGTTSSATGQTIKPLFGYVPDRENHFEEFTGRRNLQFFAGLYGPGGAHRRVPGLVELDEAADLPVRGYSLGMRRKLLLARALLHRPRLLYLDEPTANLDIHSGRRRAAHPPRAGGARRDGAADHAQHGGGRGGLRPRGHPVPRPAGRARLAAGAAAAARRAQGRRDPRATASGWSSTWSARSSVPRWRAT